MPARVLQTMLHEAAHALAHVRGIKDTSRSGNRYHNSAFAELAEELGLKRPQTRSNSIGYSACTITEETVKTYESTIKALDAAKVAHLVSLPEVIEGTRTRRQAGVWPSSAGACPSAGSNSHRMITRNHAMDSGSVHLLSGGPAVGGDVVVQAAGETGAPHSLLVGQVGQVADVHGSSSGSSSTRKVLGGSVGSRLRSIGGGTGCTGA